MNEGELSGRLGLRRLAGRRRGGDHRPRLPARRARRLAAARLPRLHRRLGRDRPLGQEQGLERHRRGDPHHLLLTDELAATYDPIYKVNPPLRTADRRRGAARRAWPTAPSTSSPPTTRRTRTRTRTASGRPPRSACSASRPRCRSSQQTMVDTGPARLGRRRRPDVRTPRPGSAGSPTTAGRSRSGEPANVVLVDPAATPDGRPGASRPACSRNTPYARDGAARPGGRDVPARPGRPCSTGSWHDAPRAQRAGDCSVLEDGRTFPGEAYGAEGETFGEAVFTTGMTGYQETLTDPSYHRQVVVMTAPHIGNTGVNDEDPESVADLGRRLRRARPRPACRPTGARSAASTTSCARRASSASAASTPAR